MLVHEIELGSARRHLLRLGKPRAVGQLERRRATKSEADRAFLFSSPFLELFGGRHVTRRFDEQRAKASQFTHAKEREEEQNAVLKGAGGHL